MLLGQTLASYDFPQRFKEAHHPEDFAISESPIKELISHHVTGHGKDTTERIFLRYSFPLESDNGHVTTTFLLDSGAPGSSLYLSAKTKKELTKHRIIKEQKTQRYLMINGKQIFIQNTPKAQQPSDILPFSLWSLFGVTTSLEGLKSHPSTESEASKRQDTREGKDAVPIQEEKETVDKKSASQDKSLEQTLQDHSSEISESRVHIPISSGGPATHKTQKVPVTPIQPGEGQKLKTSHPQQKASGTSTQQKASATSTQPAEGQKLKTSHPQQKASGTSTQPAEEQKLKTSHPQQKSTRRRKSLQQKSNVDFSKVSVDQLSDQLEQPKFG